MLTSCRCAFLLLFFIAACGPFTISILAAARPLGKINSNNNDPHDTLSSTVAHKQVQQQLSFCRSTDAGGFVDCGVFSGENTVDSNQRSKRVDTYITTEVGDIAAAGRVLESKNNGEFSDQSTSNYDILRGSTSPPGSTPSINHAAGNSMASTNSYDILRGSTSPPGSPPSINHAAGNSVATSTSTYDILRGSTTPPGSPPSINHAAGNSVATSTSTYDILRSKTSPPGSPPSINHAAGNSAAMAQKTFPLPTTI